MRMAPVAAHLQPDDAQPARLARIGREARSAPRARRRAAARGQSRPHRRSAPAADRAAVRARRAPPALADRGGPPASWPRSPDDDVLVALGGAAAAGAGLVVTQPPARGRARAPTTTPSRGGGSSTTSTPRARVIALRLAITTAAQPQDLDLRAAVAARGVRRLRPAGPRSRAPTRSRSSTCRRDHHGRPAWRAGGWIAAVVHDRPAHAPRWSGTRRSSRARAPSSCGSTSAGRWQRPAPRRAARGSPAQRARRRDLCRWRTTPCSPTSMPRSPPGARISWSSRGCRAALAAPEEPMKTRRYQLNKDAVAIIERDHPWIFRDQLSSAARVLRDGDWLRLVDGANRIVGYGMFEAEGAIAIRVLRLGAGSARRRVGARQADDRARAARPRRAQDRRAPARAVRAGARRGRRERTASGAAPDRVAGERAAARDAHRWAPPRPRRERRASPRWWSIKFGDTLVAQSYSRGRRCARPVRRGRARPRGSTSRTCCSAPRTAAAPPSSPRACCAARRPRSRTFTEDGIGVRRRSRGRAEDRHVPRPARAAPRDRDRAAAGRARAQPVRVLRHARPRRRGRGRHVDHAGRYLGARARVRRGPPRRRPGEAHVRHRRRVRVAAGPRRPRALRSRDRRSAVDDEQQGAGPGGARRRIASCIAPPARHVRPGGLLVAACCTSRVERGLFHKTVRRDARRRVRARARAPPRARPPGRLPAGRLPEDRPLATSSGLIWPGPAAGRDRRRPTVSHATGAHPTWARLR